MKKVAYIILIVLIVLHVAGVIVGFLGLILNVLSQILMLKFRRLKPVWDEYMKDSKHIL